MGIFMHIARGNLGAEGTVLLKEAEESFMRLESTAERALSTLLRDLAETRTCTDKTMAEHRGKLSLDEQTEFILLKFLVFLRYRNSDQYLRTVESAVLTSKEFGPAARAWRSNMRIFLRRIRAFLDHEDRSFSTQVLEPCREIEQYCWRPMEETKVELTVGVALEEQEFIITDRGYGSLDDFDP